MYRQVFVEQVVEGHVIIITALILIVVAFSSICTLQSGTIHSSNYVLTFIIFIIIIIVIVLVIVIRRVRLDLVAVSANQRSE